MMTARPLSLLLTAIVALLAFTGAAMASTPTSPEGTVYTGKVHADSEGYLTLHNAITDITCSVALEGELTSHALYGPTQIPLSTLSFSGCTNHWTPSAVKPGSLEILSVPGSKNGTVIWHGLTFSFTRLGITCTYALGDSEVGTLTSSTTTGATPTIDFSATFFRESGSSLCGFFSEATGNFKIDSPDYLDFDPEYGATPTSPAGTTYTDGLHASSEGHVVIDNPILDIECSSTLAGEIETHSLGEAATAPLSSVTFSGCTNDWSATVEAPGTLEVHGIPGTKNGTLTWSGAEFSFFRKGITCRYKAEGTDVGILTGSKTTGGTATIDLSGTLPSNGSDKLCGEGPGSLTGSYAVATPDYLDVDAAPGATPTSPAGTTYTDGLHASSEGRVTIRNPILDISCSSTLTGEIEGHGSGEPIRIPLSALTFTECTNDWTPTVTTPGTLNVHHLPGTADGTVTWTGVQISFFRKGITCRYKAENTVIGTLTGSKTTGGTATIDLTGTLLYDGEVNLCGEKPTPLAGSYSVQTPDYLDIDG